MGLIREVQQLTYKIDENNKLLSNKETARIKGDKLIKDIQAESKSIIFALIEEEKEENIIYKIDENTAKIADYIINKEELGQVDYIDKESGAFRTKKALVKVYNIEDRYELENIIHDIYLKEYKKIKQEQKIKQEFEKKALKEKLKKDFINYLKLDDNKKGLFDILESQEIKSDIIKEIAKDKSDAEQLDKIYYQTLNDLKRGYKQDIKEYKQEKQNDFVSLYNNKKQQLRGEKKKKAPIGGLVLFGACELLGIGKKRR